MQEQRSTDNSPLHITRLSRSSHRKPSPRRSLRTADVHNNQTAKTRETAETPDTLPKARRPRIPSHKTTMSNSRASHARRSGRFGQRQTRNIAMPDGRFKHPKAPRPRKPTADFCCCFPEPTKNQRLRSTARFLVESARGVKGKPQQSFPHPAPSRWTRPRTFASPEALRRETAGSRS